MGRPGVVQGLAGGRDQGGVGIKWWGSRDSGGLGSSEW